VTKDVTVAASAMGVEINVVRADNNRAIETASLDKELRCRNLGA